ncbi:MAG: excinuclease ABC subunit A, partial [Chloroflexi bacterium]|nr:excinuclease ABC subunit A [Chloroflexota bacterium]
MTTEQLKSKNIVIQGAREHNLKNIDVTIPRNKLVVVTGVSGSGKSTLAFDTIYAEGQRRYVESLSSYARQFLGRMDKPDVDYIEGLSPAISIDQKGTSHNPRSTVGTVTEVYDYLRLLFARIGKPHCPNCGRPVKSQTVQQIVDSILNIEKDKRIQILAPVVQRRKGEHKDVLESARKSGFIRVRVNGEIKDLNESIELDKQKWHNIEIVVDRLIINESIDKTRVSDSTEAALKQAKGIILIDVENSEDLLFSEHFACVHCQINLGELEPRTFSYNNPHGACNTCAGLGFKKIVDPDLVIPDYSISIDNGGIEAWSMSGKLNPFFASQINALSEMEGFRTDLPLNQLDDKHINLILYGSEDERRIKVTHRTRRGRRFQWNTKFEGVIKNLEKRLQQTESENVRTFIDRFMTSLPCNSCNGNKLKPEALAVTIDKKNIIEISNLPIEDSLNWINKLSDSSILSSREQTIASQILKEIQSRLKFLLNVGLDYLSLSRRASTLSGGESQRIRLATQIGSGLMGVLYVCDEPSIGLHPADDDRLITTLKNLRDVGNTVLIVEHDEAIMRSADHIIDMGPGAGEFGGEVIASGTLSQIIKSKKSLTGQYLSRTKQIKPPTKRRKSNGKTIKIFGAEENNLRNIDCEIPLGILVCVTGVSGSGKSTLLFQTLYRAMNRALNNSQSSP